MNSSTPFPTDPRFSSVTFPDESYFISAKKFVTDLRGTKRLRIDGDASFYSNVTVENNISIGGTVIITGDVVVEGSVPYVDNQTGWGLPEWTFAQTGQYNKLTDSLIIKITNLENSFLGGTYATVEYVDSKTTLNQGLVYAEPGEYPLFNSEGYYTKGVTHLASDTYFIIRDDISYSQIFQFQRGDVGVGKYLKCADDDGTVQWGDLSGVISSVSGIETTNGPSDQTSFFVTDDVGTARGWYFYPNIDADTDYNDRMEPNDIALLMGSGNAQNGLNQYCTFFGTYNGTQGLRMTSDYSIDNVIERGRTFLYGGGDTQQITLSSDGIVIQPEVNKSCSINGLLTYDYDGSPSNPTNYILAADDVNGTIKYKYIGDITNVTTPTYTSVTIDDSLTVTNNLYTRSVSNSSIWYNVDFFLSVRYFSTYSNQSQYPPPSILFENFPARNTDYAIISDRKQIGIFYPVDAQYIYNLTVPVSLAYNWYYKDNKQNNDELIYAWCMLESYQVTIEDTTNIGVFIDLPLQTIRNGKTTYFFHDRYINSSTFCQSADTLWTIEVPLTNLIIPFQADTIGPFKIFLTLNSKWKNSGEFMEIQNLRYHVNFPFNGSNPYNWSIVYHNNNPANDPYCSLSQYVTVNQDATYGVQPSGTFTYAYEPPSSVRTANVTKNLTPYDSNKVIALGNTDINLLTVQTDIYAPNGVLRACGISGRPGLPTSSNTFPYGAFNSTWSYNTWGNNFNFYWTVAGKWQIWVDYTLIYEGSPNYSDYRLKSNLRTLPPVLDRVAQIPLHMYDFESYEIMPTITNKIGFLAHEVADLFPEFPHLITNEKDAVDDQNKPLLQSYDDKELVIICLKAIQELREEVENLKKQLNFICNRN